MKQTWSSWLDNQLQFLRSHSYFTTEAQTLRDAGKQENIALVKRLLREG